MDVSFDAMLHDLHLHLMLRSSLALDATLHDLHLHFSHMRMRMGLGWGWEIPNVSLAALHDLHRHFMLCYTIFTCN